MTCIAYRDGLLATDRQSTSGETAYTGIKLFVRDIQDHTKWAKPKVGAEYDEAFAVTGSADANILMLNWYLEGADLAKYPANQTTDNWGRLLVVECGRVTVYERLPAAVEMLDPYVAFGSGSEYALGAMYHGATAIQAVEAATYWAIGCGRGIDYVRVKQ